MQCGFYREFNMNCGNAYMKLISFLLIMIPISESNSVLIQYHIDKLASQIDMTLMDPILFWNLVMLQACGDDYDPSIVSTRNQYGPGATARAFAIVHSAMHDSMIAFN